MFKTEKILSNETIYIKVKLNSNILKRLNTYIKNKNINVNNKLAGNIKGSYSIEDKDNYFFNNFISYLINKHTKDFSYAVPYTLTENCKYVLNTFWVNIQKKHEFNPIHDHSGVWSFVVWMQIPSSYKKEKELPFIKHSNNPLPNTFNFFTTSSLGKILKHQYMLEPSDEGTMLFFPAQLNHCVYPFYLSNKERLSISGNVSLNPREII